MIRVITNSLGSGDWVTVQGLAGEVLFEGHSVRPADLVDILNSIVDQGAELIEVNDEQLEEGEY